MTDPGRADESRIPAATRCRLIGAIWAWQRSPNQRAATAKVKLLPSYPEGAVEKVLEGKKAVCSGPQCSLSPGAPSRSAAEDAVSCNCTSFHRREVVPCKNLKKWIPLNRRRKEKKDPALQRQLRRISQQPKRVYLQLRAGTN